MHEEINETIHNGQKRQVGDRLGRMFILFAAITLTVLAVGSLLNFNLNIPLLTSLIFSVFFLLEIISWFFLRNKEEA
jgi:hypothetical protein